MHWGPGGESDIAAMTLPARPPTAPAAPSTGVTTTARFDIGAKRLSVRYERFPSEVRTTGSVNSTAPGRSMLSSTSSEVSAVYSTASAGCELMKI